MQDQVILNTTLTLSKNMCELLMHGSVESQGDINETFTECFTKYIDLQQKIFTEMQNKGFYKMENATETKINKALNKHENKMN